MKLHCKYLVTVAATLALWACGGDSSAGNDTGLPDAGFNHSALPDIEDDVDDATDCEPRFADDDGRPFETLSEYCFFRGETADHDPMPGVVLYDVTAPLYSDLSEKMRFIILPEGETISFDPADHWGWPDKTIISKTFYYYEDFRDREGEKLLLETRLLIKEQGSWKSEVYIWNDDQTEAHHNNLGRRLDISFIDDDGAQRDIQYRIPNRNQCAQCHAQDGKVLPIGPRTYQLGTAFGRMEGEPSQLEHFEDLGLFDEPLPSLDSLPSTIDYFDESFDLEDRARSYLDASCAHCHNPGGRAASSNLHLGIDIVDESRIGICKRPVAAGGAAGGLSYDIVPGHPEESIMIYRMDSTDDAIRMPELPLTTIDEFGVSLISEWIAQMEPPGCE